MYFIRRFTVPAADGPPVVVNEVKTISALLMLGLAGLVPALLTK